MNKTILVSNRLPFELRSDDGGLTIRPSVGGLATGLRSVHEQGESLWVGWPGLSTEELQPNIAQADSMIRENRCVPVYLDQSQLDDFYTGFSNNALWPLFHYFMEFARYDPAQWESYRRVNKTFADAVLKCALPGDRIWVHDYQLLLVPQMIREQNPDLSIGFFLHIPFPAFEIFRTFPWREELLQGMLGADLIGFHTYDYVQHFLNSVRRISGKTVIFNEVASDGRLIKADSFPMGIDYDRFHDAARSYDRPGQQRTAIWSRMQEHQSKNPGSKIVLSIDRMDYTKGIPQRLRAFEYFLEKYPQYVEKVRLVMLVVPSRAKVPQYKKLKRATDELVGRINGKFATISWTPVWYFYRGVPFEELIDLYTSSNIALITPVRDGMNLVAKEYVATRIHQDGVLILSEMAGAATEMHEAIFINPTNVDQCADALKQALEMPIDEQRTRFSSLQKRLSRYTVDIWARDFMTALHNISDTILPTDAIVLTNSELNEMANAFVNAGSRLLLLDFDGTLVDFQNDPQNVFPDTELLELLDGLQNTGTEIAIISGRGREHLEKCFGNTPYSLVTDHGVWIRREQKWEETEYLKTDWKQRLRPILENFMDRTPGAFIEDKAFSLAWHYRRCDADLADLRTRELRHVLSAFVADNSLAVLQGDKVIEVKSSAINKGRAASRLIAGRTYDFIFAIGDDVTDEFMFGELPEDSWTVKVGNAPTSAKYRVKNIGQVRTLLNRFHEKFLSEKQ